MILPTNLLLAWPSTEDGQVPVAGPSNLGDEEMQEAMEGMQVTHGLVSRPGFCHWWRSLKAHKKREYSVYSDVGARKEQVEWINLALQQFWRVSLQIQH